MILTLFYNFSYKFNFITPKYCVMFFKTSKPSNKGSKTFLCYKILLINLQYFIMQIGIRAFLDLTYS